MEGTYLDIMKDTQDKLKANVMLNGETLTAFPPRSGTRQGCALSPLLGHVALETLARAIRQEKGLKGTQIGKVAIYLC